MHRISTRRANNYVVDRKWQKDTKRPKSLEARIRKFYDLLPESERRIADCILDFPGEIAAYSATELSQISGGLRRPLRGCSSFGFRNFEEARRTARDARVWGSPMYLMTKDPQPDSFRERLKSHLEQDVTAVHRIFDSWTKTNLPQ